MVLSVDGGVLLRTWGSLHVPCGLCGSHHETVAIWLPEDFVKRVRTALPDEPRLVEALPPGGEVSGDIQFGPEEPRGGHYPVRLRNILFNAMCRYGREKDGDSLRKIANLAAELEEILQQMAVSSRY